MPIRMRPRRAYRDVFIGPHAERVQLLPRMRRANLEGLLVEDAQSRVGQAPGVNPSPCDQKNPAWVVEIGNRNDVTERQHRAAKGKGTYSACPSLFKRDRSEDDIADHGEKLGR